MAQNDLVIANQSFPSFRSDLNSALQAINTSHSGTSRPSGAVAGTIWLDTTGTPTANTLKFFDGTDDISLATINYTANTVDWLDSSVTITGLSTTATGTVLTLSDTATTSSVNLIIDNDKEIRFREATANGTNYVSLSAPTSLASNIDFTLPIAPTVNNQALISTTAGVMAFTPYTFPTADGTSNQALVTNGSGVLSFASAGTISYGLFRKANPTIVAWTKTGAFTLTTSSIIYVEVNGTVLTISSGTSVSMPSATVGTDYAIWCSTAGALSATTDHTNPPSSNARKLGGFHYANGGNATGTSGGNTTPAINEYSMWDLKFRPTCDDPRGMTLIGGNFWSDIYLTNTVPDTNGTSKYNVTIADGSSPPKIPSKFGGNGTTDYGSYTWWEQSELLSSYGKRPPSVQEFCALAYGTTEATSSGGTDVPTTGVSGTGATTTWEKFTSKWGVIQSSGCMYVWGRDFGGGAGSAAWTANTEGRGSTYQLSNAVILGGNWYSTSDSGSRSSAWHVSPTVSGSDIGSRGVADHLLVD
jgi:hypothetical protein